VSRPARRRRRYATQAMSLEQLEHWIERLEPPPLIDSVSMLDGYLTAIIVGPCSIDPYEWMRHMLGPHSAIGADGSEQLPRCRRSPRGSTRSARASRTRQANSADL